MREFRRTKKQLAIIEVLLKHADAGRESTMEMLRADLPHGMKVTPQAIRSSLKYLAEHGYVDSHRPGLFTLYRPTPATYTAFRSSP